MTEKNCLDVVAKRANAYISRMRTAALSFESSELSKEGVSLNLWKIAAEHHQAICSLLSDSHFNSAFALVRPCIEVSLRSMWLTRIASVKQVENVLKADKQAGWPTLEGLIGSIGAESKTSKHLSQLLPPRITLNEFAHGGIGAILHGNFVAFLPDLRIPAALSCLFVIDDIVATSFINQLSLHGKVGDGLRFPRKLIAIRNANAKIVKPVYDRVSSDSESLKDLFGMHQGPAGTTAA